MTSSLRNLESRFPDSTVWIIGTGPGLDRLDPAEITGPRVFLNRSAFLPQFNDTAQDGESYWLVMDDAGFIDPDQPWWNEHLVRVKSGEARQTGVFLNPLLNSTPQTPAPTGDNIVHWAAPPKLPHRRVALAMGRVETAIRGFLYIECGSAAPATHLAWLMGARAVRYVGLDGGHARAECLQHLYREPEMGGFGYSMSTSCAHEVAAELGLEVETSHLQESTP